MNKMKLNINKGFWELNGTELKVGDLIDIFWQGQWITGTVEKSNPDLWHLKEHRVVIFSEQLEARRK